MMPRTKATGSRGKVSRPQTVPLGYAGKWVAWSADGQRIVASGRTFAACERAAAVAGFGPGMVAIDRIPVHRRLAGPGG